MVAVPGRPPGCVEDENGLERSLDETDECGEQHQNGVLVYGEVSPNHAEHSEEVQSALGYHEKDAVQLHDLMRIIAEFSHLHQSDDNGQACEQIESQLGDVRLQDGQVLVLGLVDEDEKYDEADDGKHENENTREEAFVRFRAVHLEFKDAIRIINIKSGINWFM